MTDTKLVITVIIILGILFLALGSHPSTKDFFSSFQNNIQSPVVSNGPVNFEISMDLIHLSSNVENVDIDIYSDNITLDFGDGKFTSNKEAKLYGYKGTISLENRSLILDGSISKLESDTFSFSKVTSVKSIVIFTNLTMEDFYVDKIETNITATLKTQGVETTINNKNVLIEKPKGLFFITDKIYIKGAAYKISIPDAKILVSG